MFVFLPSNKSVQSACSDLGYLQFAQTLLKYFDSDFGNRMYGMKQMTSQFFLLNRIRYKTRCLVRVFVVFYSLLTCGAPTNGRFVEFSMSMFISKKILKLRTFQKNGVRTRQICRDGICLICLSVQCFLSFRFDY